jgi:tetratricopeptide (TPR) repeat protein/NAD-dependent dihydropyrimidine dehydrogenase PreA subunit
MSKCVLCRRCVTACNEIQGTGILNAQNRGFDTIVSPAMNLPIGEVNCAFCGQCTVVCPVGALKETDSIGKVWDAINDPKKRVVVQVAPAVRVAIGEEFGCAPGTQVTGKLAAALHMLGFDDVFDTNFTADLTIMEEGTELLNRLKNALTGSGPATLPMITSCSPGWIKYVEHTYPDTDALLAMQPHDPFFLELKGQILLEGGKPKEAIAPLREATERSGNMPLIAAMLGHALVSTEDPQNFNEAKQVLKEAVGRDNQNPFAWYQLGVIYDREGDPARAALATAERSNLEDNPKLAFASAQMAMKGIPPGSPDWLRAQDIAMVSKTELAKKDKKYRDESDR